MPGALAIIAVAAELATVAEGLKAAIDITEEAKKSGRTHLLPEELQRVKAAMEQGLPKKSVFDTGTRLVMPMLRLPKGIVKS